MARPRKAHWRHIAVPAGQEHEDAFRCDRHGRICRRVWVHEQQIEEADSLELRMLDLDPQDIVETPEHRHDTGAANRARAQQLPLTPQPAQQSPAAPASAPARQHEGRPREPRWRRLMRRLRRRNRP